MRKPEKLLGTKEIADELGKSRQVIHNRKSRDPRYLPPPNYLGPKDAPLWKRSTLEKAGVLAG